jgi:orotidine-5'-phosphate decarboxylase
LKPLKALTKLAIAHDTNDREDFLKILKLLGDLPLIHKIGLKMLPRLEKSDWKHFHDKEIFVDAKLHDIPSQVSDAVKAYGELGAKYLTVHLSGGKQMLIEAQKAAAAHNIQLLGVSILTSLSDVDLTEIGMTTTQISVEKLIKVGKNAGLNAFVMSAQEVAHIKKIYPDIYSVTPGISFEGELKHSDQNRTSTIQEAVRAGSDMLVIGRAILKAPKPYLAAQRALELIASCS